MPFNLHELNKVVKTAALNKAKRIVTQWPNPISQSNCVNYCEFARMLLLYTPDTHLNLDVHKRCTLINDAMIYGLF